MREADRDLILLFFKDFESDSFLRGDRYVKRVVRPVYHRMRRRPQVSGFAMWFRLLVQALEAAGLDVRVNDRRTAARHPRHPVGLIGYPHLLDGWSLPNPALLGPALFDHPSIAPSLMEDPRYRRYLVTCDWMEEMFAPAYGRDLVGRWYAGMDLVKWPDMSSHDKRFDVLVYDKIRWERPRYQAQLLRPVLGHLETRGLTYQIIRYREYDHPTYRAMLAQSRAMVFLCEHETQGLAYQEAMAANLPVLAWDNGYWLDPQRSRYQHGAVEATSVPYFSPLCGERFKAAEYFPQEFDRFWSRLHSYRSRDYVRSHLSLAGSAALYLQQYRQVAEGAPAAP